MMRARWGMVCIFVLVALWGGTALAAQPVLGVAAVGLEHHWDINAYNGVVEKAKALGAEVLPFDGERRAEKQLSDVKTLISRKVDAIIVILGQKQSLSPALKEAREAGIPVITVDFQDESSLCNVTTNNYAAMSELVLKIVDDMRGKGEIAIFYRPGAPIAELRKGVLDLVLKAFPEVKIVASEAYVVPGTVPDAYNKAKDMLRANPNIKAFWSVFDMPMIGAAQAITDLKMEGQVKAYGFDGDPTAMKMIMDGKSGFAATVAQQPYLIGEVAAQTAMDIVQGKTVPSMKFVPHALVTPENVQEVWNTMPQYKNQ